MDMDCEAHENAESGAKLTAESNGSGADNISETMGRLHIGEQSSHFKRKPVSWARVRVDPDYPRVDPYVTGTGNPYP
ncbi:hypothetical protein M569_16565 [Genlisea aurea]|uniref:Uncharacterized protein n=1 Tax=Genlisea aurea TaxID=192259 RepID=S8DFU4_9LAMI|nr:hypothetical protein M569_16565 [Genlisea aurea]